MGPIDGPPDSRYIPRTPMTHPVINRLPKSRVELTFTITPDEVKPYLDEAAKRISESRPLKGFRPGKAGYDDVKRAYGEMAIWEATLEPLVRSRYVKAVLDENIETVGQPEINVDTLVPGQPIVFTVTANVMPQATKVAEYSTPRVTRKQRTVADEEVEKAIEELRLMRRTEAVTASAATKDHLVDIDLDILKDNVLIEGGSTKNHRVFLNETHYIPGFAEKLVGVKKGDETRFELDFPADHYQKHLAGAPATFQVKVNEVYELAKPELNDEFAKGVGVESVEKLRELIRTNLQEEEDRRASEAAEIELLQTLTKESTFSEIPDLLVSEEVRRMIRELQSTLEERGGNMEDYLSSLKRSKDDLALDFIPQAMDRIKTAVLIKAIAKLENIAASDADIDAEQDRLLAGVKADDKNTREIIISPEYRDYIASQMRNRQVIELLKQKGIK